MQLTKKQAQALLLEMESNSRAGSKIADEIRVANTVNGPQIVAIGYTCNKRGCNCTGGWWEGEERGTEFTKLQLEAV